MNFKVAVLQMRSVDRQPEKNTDVIISQMQLAARGGADILLLPECFITGYELPRENADALPDGSGDRRGWWADSAAPAADGDRTGSRLWLLSREKTLPEVLRRARDYAEEALAWLLEDGAAKNVSVHAAMPRRGLLALTVVITLPDGSPRTFTVNRSF